MNTFYLPKIETRAVQKGKTKRYIVKGYATVPNHIYAYKKEEDSQGNAIRTFNEYFTDEAIANIKRKASSENIWVDYGHSTGTSANMENMMNKLEVRTGVNLSGEKDYLKNMLNISDIPMFKLNNIQIDNKGLFVEIEGNPFYRELNDEHMKKFDSTWKSLENGFINTMSLNMKPTSFVDVNEGLRQINDVDIFGISLLSGAANDMANITEVAMRCVEKSKKEDEKCQKTRRRMIM